MHAAHGDQRPYLCIELGGRASRRALSVLIGAEARHGDKGDDKYLTFFFFIEYRSYKLLNLGINSHARAFSQPWFTDILSSRPPRPPAGPEGESTSVSFFSSSPAPDAELCVVLLTRFDARRHVPIPCRVFLPCVLLISSTFFFHRG